MFFGMLSGILLELKEKKYYSDEGPLTEDKCYKKLLEAVNEYQKTNIRERITETIIRHEGFEYKPYKCTEGKTTIGVGRNLEDVGLSYDEIMLLLSNDIDKVINQCDSNISFYRYAPEDVKLVLLNMCFQLGITGLLKFKKTLKYLEQRNYKKASVEMLDSRWAVQTPKRAKELSSIIAEAV